MKRLLIISHTEHYINRKDEIVGLAPTVTEVNHLLSLFDTIVHVAMLHNIIPPKNTLPYQSEKVIFKPIPTVGGKTLMDKVRMMSKAPNILATVIKELNDCDVFQFRAPTGIGVFVIPYLIAFSKKAGWFKYAGNWQQKNVPLAYRFQRWLVSKQKRKVTINGEFSDQPTQCLSFKNPCFTKLELEKGNAVRATKEKLDNLEFCFVGRLEKKKGLDLFIETLKTLDKSLKRRITKVHIVGGGDISIYKPMTSAIGIECKFYSWLSPKALQEIYKRSHAMVLPSYSEGFPKVITEAINYGALPIVSELPTFKNSIIHNRNALVVKNLDVESLKDFLVLFIKMSNEKYRDMITSPVSNLENFTYDHYVDRIKNEVIFLS